MKTCRICRARLPESSFYIKRRGPQKWLTGECKRCKNKRSKEYNLDNADKIHEQRKLYRERNKERLYAHTADWVKNNPLKLRASQVKRLYGLEYHEHWALLEYQQHRCPICGEGVNLWSDIDHDHASGKIRGVLCASHNTGLGEFGENPKLLRNAASYLERNGR